MLVQISFVKFKKIVEIAFGKVSWCLFFFENNAKRKEYPKKRRGKLGLGV